MILRSRLALPFGTVAALFAAQSAAAQTTEPAAGPTPTPAPPAASQPGAVNEVIVTGSRIARRDYVSDSPVVTLGAAAIAAVGTPTLEASLNQLPQLSPSAGSASSFTAHGGQANVDLRGLGEQRTLVLLDGIRLQPSNPDGSIDLNIIPPALVDNVEVITGGASAVYGSDAIAGVLNIKLKSHFSGAELDATYGATDKGDGETKDVSGLFGGNFDNGKGNAIFALDYSTRDAVSFTARSYLRNQALSTYVPYGQYYDDPSNRPSQAAVNSVFAKYGVAAGAIPRQTQFGFNADGSLFAENPNTHFLGPVTGPITVLNGVLWDATGNSNLAQIPLTRYSAYAHSTYEVNDHLQLFGSFLFTKYSTETDGPAPAGGPPLSTLLVPLSNPFIPADLVPILASRPNATAPFTFLDRFDMLGPRIERDDYSIFQATLGGKGTVGFKDWTWSADATFGQTDYTQTEINYPSLSAVRTLLAAPGGGSAICTGGFDPFGNVPISASCLRYIRRQATNRQNLEQSGAEANISGSVLALPAGDLRFSAGADYRKDTYKFTPDSEVATGDLINYLPVQATGGSENVAELYGELLVPVLRGLPFIQELNLDLGYRFSDYNTIGTASTYKADFDWRIFDSFRLRGGYERAIRAPSVGELYLPGQQNQVSLGTLSATSSGGDPCDINSSYRTTNANKAPVAALCVAQGVPSTLVSSFVNTSTRAPYTTAGNPNLQQETADTYSIGAVWRPHIENPLFSRISLSVDYYHIALDRAIGSVTTTVAVQKCFNADGSNPTYSQTNYYCSLISRDPNSGLISQVVNPELNLGGYRTDGVDIEADWTFGLGAVGLKDDYGRVTFTTVINRLLSFDIQTLPGSPFNDYSGTIGNTQVDAFADAHPEWKANSSATYSYGPVDVSLHWRYIGSMGNAANVGTTSTLQGVKAISYFDLSGAWRIGSKLELRAGVYNLANQQPPVLNTSTVGQYTTDLNTYDIIGRRFTVSLKARF